MARFGIILLLLCGCDLGPSLNAGVSLFQQGEIDRLEDKVELLEGMLNELGEPIPGPQGPVGPKGDTDDLGAVDEGCAKVDVCHNRHVVNVCENANVEETNDCE